MDELVQKIKSLTCGGISLFPSVEEISQLDCDDYEDWCRWREMIMDRVFEENRDAYDALFGS